MSCRPSATMGVLGQTATVLLILLFSIDVFTDVATGVELVLNDRPFCEQHCTALHCTALHCTVQHTVLYSTALYNTLHFNIQHTALHCTVLLYAFT